MLRRTVFLAIAALAASAIVAAPAGAAAKPPPTGVLSCLTHGDASLSMGGMPAVTPSTRNSVLRGDGGLDSCDASGVSGGRAVITAGEFTMRGVVPRGATCATLFSNATPIEKLHVTIMLKNTFVDAHFHIHVLSVATLRPTFPSIVASGNGFALSATVEQNVKGTAPFGGEAVNAQLNFDNFSDALNCSNGSGASLSNIPWSPAGGSTFSITPSPTGKLVCSTTGAATLKPHGIPAGSASTSTTTLKAKGDLDPCDASGVIDAKAVINAGTIGFTGHIPRGASCATLFSSPLVLGRAQLDVKMQNVNVNGFGFTVKRTVAHVRAHITSITNGPGGFLLLTEPISGHRAFHGETMAMLLDVDNLTDVANCTAGSAPLTELDWSSAGGSMVAVGI